MVEIALIGGGIGGLATALYLERAGIACTIYESSANFSELGVGINLMPHAMRALDEIGVCDKVRDVALEPERLSFFNRHGQLIMSESLGRHAGFNFPHYSVHRGDLHEVLLDAAKAKLGADKVRMSHRLTSVEETDGKVTLHFADGRPSATADAAIGCDGVHSTVRKQFYPNEGAFAFGGINMWRGSTRYRPILDGKTVILAGSLAIGKLVIYPMRDYGDGTHLINWNVEITSDVAGPNQWNKHGRIEDFIWRYDSDRFDWLDVPDMFRKADMVLEYPMVDRDPIPRWTFGRITLLGDAAHPMYPRSGNGAAQSILDGRALASLLQRMGPAEALAAYEAERLQTVNKIVVASRSSPPDLVIETVEKRTDGKPFARLDDVISRQELDAITERFRRLTGGDAQTVNR